jgi:hypothetical protein
MGGCGDFILHIRKISIGYWLKAIMKPSENDRMEEIRFRKRDIK